MPSATESKREEILEIAAALFMEHGYAATSIRTLAVAAHISQATLYYYIGSKSDLLVALHNSYIDDLLQRLPGVLESDAPAEVKLRAFVQTLMDSLEHNRTKMAAFLRERRSLTLTAAAMVQEKRDRVDRMLDEVLEEGIATNRFGGPPVKSVRLAILGMISWAVEWFNPGGPCSAQQFAEDFADLTLFGLCSEEAKHRSLHHLVG